MALSNPISAVTRTIGSGFIGVGSSGRPRTATHQTRNSMIPSIPAERILVIQFRMIGDVLLCTPVVRALRHHYPKSYIAFCAEPVPAGALKGNPFIDEVIIHPRPATWRQEVAFWRHIRRSRFDLVVDLMGNPRSALLSCMSG